MKTNVNNTAEKYTKKAVEALKSEIKASALDEIELTNYGIQIYAYDLTGEEYTVIMKAERNFKTGRYYFVTADRRRVAWSQMDPEKLIVAAVDFLDRIEEEEKRAAEAVARLELYGLQHLNSRFFCDWVRPLLDTMGTPYHIEATGVNDLMQVIDLVAIDPADRVPSYDQLAAAPSRVLEAMKADRIKKAEALHAESYFIAAAKVSELTGQISEIQEKRREAAERADRIEAEREANKSGEFLAEFKEGETIKKTTATKYPAAMRYAARLIADGATVTDCVTYYHIDHIETVRRVTIDTADRETLAELLTRKAAAAEAIAADCRAHDLEKVAERSETRATRCRAAVAMLRPTPEAVTIETPAPETIEGEKGDIIADTIKGAAAKVAGLVLLAVTLTTGTADTIATTDTPDVAEILTTDPAAELVALRAAGLTVTRYDIKTAPATINGEAPTC